MLLRRGVPMEQKPFQLGVRIEQPQAPIDRVRYGAAPDTQRSAQRSTAHPCRPARAIFSRSACGAGGYVMPSVSDPGYFCTNGMSESRHDSPFANSGLVVTIEPGETGGSHPLAGVIYQQRVERLAYLATGRSYEAPLQWARDFLGDRKSRGKVPTSYRRGGQGIDLGLFLPQLVMEALVNGLPKMDRRFGGRFLARRDVDRPGITRQLARAHHPRAGKPAEPGNLGPLPVRRRGGLRGRNHQRGRRRLAHGPGDCCQVCRRALNEINETTDLRNRAPNSTVLRTTGILARILTIQ